MMCPVSIRTQNKPFKFANGFFARSSTSTAAQAKSCGIRRTYYSGMISIALIEG
jgi:hypothetical protein